MKRKLIFLVAILCVSVVAVSACAPAAAPAVQPPAEQPVATPVATPEAPVATPEATPVATPEATPPPVATADASFSPVPVEGMAGREAKITMDDAIKAVQAAYPDYKMGRAELDVEGGVLYWEVEIFDKFNEDHDIYVDATTGVVISRQDLAAKPANTGTPTVTQEQAQKAVMAKYPGCTITEIEYDEERGYFFWQFDIFTKDNIEQDIYVDAYNGNVMNKMEYKNFKMQNGLDD